MIQYISTFFNFSKSGDFEFLGGRCVRLPNYEVGYTVLKSANVSVVSRRARRDEHGHIRLGLEFRRGRRYLSKM